MKLLEKFFLVFGPALRNHSISEIKWGKMINEGMVALGAEQAISAAHTHTTLAQSHHSVNCLLLQ